MKRNLPWGAIAILLAAAPLAQLVGACGSSAGIDAIPDAGADATLDGVAPGSSSSSSGSNSSGSSSGSSGSPDDAGVSYADSSLGDASTPYCKDVGAACASSSDCCTANCDGTTKQCATALGACKAPGAACGTANECCTGACVNGTCADKQCVPDKPTAGDCLQAGDCCSGICTNNKCASVNPGASCRTSGNPCTTGADCCSQLCNNGLCSSAVSFCTQQGEICSTNFECCTGNCVIGAGATTGTCGAPTAGGGVPAGCKPAGEVCGTGTAAADGALPPCDQTCCSRACGYFGAAPGFRVCQPPSGCKPTGEVCRNDSDCCGWSGAPPTVKGPVTCSKASPTDEFGQCDNGGACREAGSICDPGTSDSCSAENNCCEGVGYPSDYCNSHPENCCNKDALGIPRCLLKPVDCSAGAPPAGTTCATSADCCGNPCVNDKCGAAGSCVGQGSQCTNTSDCCPGLPCVQGPGSDFGVCGGSLTSDGGVSDASTGGGTGGGGGGDGGTSADGGACALYGQICAVNGDCCDGVPCTAGRCRLP